MSTVSNNYNDHGYWLLRRTRKSYYTDDDSDDDTLHVGNGSKHLTPSQKAMLEHMEHLQMIERMPWVCWRDFHELNLPHGTIRNNLSKLKKLGFIEYSHRSNDAYYKLPKNLVKKVMTLDHVWGTDDDTTIIINNNNTTTNKHDSAFLIERLTFDAPAAHNIRLRFHCHNIYNTLLRLRAAEKILPVSEDLVLPRETLENGTIKAGITVHQSDNVSISLKCSDHPIHFNIAGLAILNSSLCRLEERLRSKLLNIIDIPHFDSWIVTMWHVGVDSKERYAGPAYEETWNHITGEMYRVYSRAIKKEKNHRNLRLERQEYPKIPLHEAVEQKLSRVLGGGTGSGSRGAIIKSL